MTHRTLLLAFIALPLLALDCAAAELAHPKPPKASAGKQPGKTPPGGQDASQLFQAVNKACGFEGRRRNNGGTACREAQREMQLYYSTHSPQGSPPPAAQARQIPPREAGGYVDPRCQAAPDTPACRHLGAAVAAAHRGGMTPPPPTGKQVKSFLPGNPMPARPMPKKEP